MDIKYIDETVAAMLRTKFALGLFESTYLLTHRYNIKITDLTSTR